MKMADAYNMGTVDPQKLSNFIEDSLKPNNQDFDKNMKSDYVTGNNMLHNFASMLSSDDIELDAEKSKVIENKQKNTAELASQEELDPAQEEFFAQWSKKLKLDVDFCKTKFAEVLESDDEAVEPKNTSKTMQNRGRDKTLDNYSKAYNPKNTQQTGGMFNKLDKKMELKAVIKKFAKKYKLNPKAIRKSLKTQIKQASKKNNLNGLTKLLKNKKPDSKNNKHKVTQPFSVQGVSAVLSPRTTPQGSVQQKGVKGF